MPNRHAPQLVTDGELLAARNVLDRLFWETSAAIDSMAIVTLDEAIDLVDGILLARKAG